MCPTFPVAICGRVHVCMRCNKAMPPCCLEPFACPFINEDENQECPECEEATVKEMYEAMEGGDAE